MKRPAAIAALSLAACSAHIAPYEPKRRVYVPQEAPERRVDPATAGSMLSQGPGLVADAKSFGIGDLVTVRVLESATAERSAGTETQRESEIDASIDAMGAFERLRASNPALALDPSKLLNVHSKMGHRGAGSTERKDHVAFVVTTSVKQVLDNGNVFIEGDRVVKVNDEEHHYYVSGVARPSDVSADNTILSSALSEAEIEFVGKGDVTDGQRKGWLTRVLDWVWPF